MKKLAIITLLLVLCCCRAVGGGRCCAEQQFCLGLVDGCLCSVGLACEVSAP
jgi:hypothetical protein